MADDVFKQSRKKITPEEIVGGAPTSDPLESVKRVQNAVARDQGRDSPLGTDTIKELPFQVSGQIPPDFLAAINKARQPKDPGNEPDEVPFPTADKSPPREPHDDLFDAFEAPPERETVHRPAPKQSVPGSDNLEALLKQLSDHHHWEEFEFPSRGKFYTNIPRTIHVRAMTGEEEQILATPRWVKRGTAIDKIFRKCIKEDISTESLLSIDRNNLLIFLRGISYTPEYDVEIKCPGCSTKFGHVIDLNDLEVDLCPDDFGPEKLQGHLPVSKFRYRFRLSTGQDETEIATYREKRIQQWGDQGDDDTLLYRTALLLEEVEGVTLKKELAMLLKKLPIQDVAHLRNEISQPPFGVNTELTINCVSCPEEFKIDLPLETNFFFPRKKTKTPV